ncbi:MAG: hypothetical protein IPI67_04940 [Myxococcales bacterium]|nr:hypothetical protein [Myxococcales bacterium]
MKPRRSLRRLFALTLLVGVSALYAGCGIMFGDVDDSCSGSCSAITDCPILACGCENKVTRVGLGCSTVGGCCHARGSICQDVCEGHGGVAKVDDLTCKATSDCSSCAGPICNCWDGNDIRGACVGSSGAACCLSGVKDWEALCHGFCANHGGLEGVTQ